MDRIGASKSGYMGFCGRKSRSLYGVIENTIYFIYLSVCLSRFVIIYKWDTGIVLTVILSVLNTGVILDREIAPGNI